jgi:LmbE family N-acetylglucosaminyl deacetylase
VRIRKVLETIAWRLAGFRRPSRVHYTSSIKVLANPIEILPSRGDRFLILSPHPDDEAIGCGGLICRALQQEAEVMVAYITDGALGGDPAVRRQEALAVRDLCLQKLGRTFAVHFGSHRELNIETLRLQQEIRNWHQQFSPHYLLLPHSEDNHRDHFVVQQAIRSQARELQNQVRLQLLGYEIWNPLQMGAFVDISEFNDLKREMISLYRSQKRSKDYASLILALNFYRAGCLPGTVKFAEGLEIIPE